MSRKRNRRCLFAFSVKREIRHFQVEAVRKRQGNVQKSVMHVRSCLFIKPTGSSFSLKFSLPSLKKNDALHLSEGWGNGEQFLTYELIYTNAN